MLQSPSSPSRLPGSSLASTAAAPNWQLVFTPAQPPQCSISTALRTPAVLSTSQGEGREEEMNGGSERGLGILLS